MRFTTGIGFAGRRKNFVCGRAKLGVARQIAKPVVGVQFLDQTVSDCAGAARQVLVELGQYRSALKARMARARRVEREVFGQQMSRAAVTIESELFFACLRREKYAPRACDFGALRTDQDMSWAREQKETGVRENTVPMFNIVFLLLVLFSAHWHTQCAPTAQT